MGVLQHRQSVGCVGLPEEPVHAQHQGDVPGLRFERRKRTGSPKQESFSFTTRPSAAAGESPLDAGRRQRHLVYGGGGTRPHSGSARPPGPRGDGGSAAGDGSCGRRDDRQRHDASVPRCGRRTRGHRQPAVQEGGQGEGGAAGVGVGSEGPEWNIWLDLGFGIWDLIWDFYDGNVLMVLPINALIKVCNHSAMKVIWFSYPEKNNSYMEHTEKV